MSLVKIEVDADNVLGRQFTELERTQLPFAVMQACNATAVEIRDVWARTAPRVFDRPTPMTVKAAQYEKATKNRLYATIKLRDEAVGGTPPAKYLLPQVEGGTRRKKGVELLLQSKGAMPAGMFAVPGRGAELDAFGNIKASQVNRILSQLGARRDPYQNETEASRARRRNRAAKRGVRGSEFFALRARRGKLLPGIYERLTTGFGSALRSVLVFVRGARYQKRFDIFGLAERTWNRLMPFHFNRELEKALASSKYRGRR
ncbi:hypothetical protein CSC62_07540 [Pseudoxanthomonas jiangsuensis]|uniref:hypothetical protein n=1 Tax=Pseudoxanthomonas jiangsuensis TaxID=619688 RepID=UPI0013913E6B|nr:hypothetical protein [Pseudoxanthomonas jiangsuensis]KAF1697989.1 hypothetical protein CSC62_07540 [Pseudoxanthomonas jiangsuensis]